MSDSDQEGQGSAFPGFSGVADDPGELIDRLSELRPSRGLSQTEVAARMGTSQSASRDATQSAHGTADDITRHAKGLSQQRSRYLTALSAPTGHDGVLLAEEATNGRGHTAEEALALGIIDTIASRS